jgi:hypothetical protein
MNYSPSTQERIADIKNGLIVQTAKELAYSAFGGSAQAYPFRVYNRVLIHALFFEVGATTLANASSTTEFQFNFISDTPSIAVQPISATSSNCEGFVRGRRISLPGATIATATNVDGSAGISIACPGGASCNMVVGVAPSAAVDPSIGRIGFLYLTTALNAGTGQFTLYYTPIDPGAYVIALL